MTVAEGGIRSPMVIAGPGIEGGRMVGAFTYVTDIMPTILEIAGIEHPTEIEGRQVEPMRGRSLTGILSGTTDAVYSGEDVIAGELPKCNTKFVSENVQMASQAVLPDYTK